MTGPAAPPPPPPPPSGPSAARPSLQAASLEEASAFVSAAGLRLDEVGPTRLVGHLDLGAEHHTPWGVIHGGVYCSAVESAASIGGSTAVAERGEVAVGLTNTTHFLRALSGGRVDVEAVAVYQGRTHQLWRVDLTDGEGRLVAHGEVRLQNIPGRPPTP